ncbi:metal-dependent hydrolase [Neisseriaceae bacterium TC5R-5]|nr:metal-dependent hydrolase [Neisseriaceae bacterium TC5R-5]
MPTIFSHAVAGSCIAYLALPAKAPPAQRNKALWLCALLAMLPDLDLLTLKLGIAYTSPWGHRGFSHSIAFAVAAAAMAALLSRQLWQRLGFSLATAWLLLSLVILSHPLLDMFTDASYGPAWLLPWGKERYLADWRPITGAPLSLHRWLGQQGWRVFTTELLYIWLPCSLLYLTKRQLVRKHTT